MKKLYTSLVFILAFLACKKSVVFLTENVNGFATADLSGSANISVLAFGLIVIVATAAYKLTPRI